MNDTSPGPVAPGPVIILGARSDMGRAIAGAFARRGHPMMLAARNPETLAEDADDLRIRHGVTVTTHAFDALDTAGHGAFADALPELPAVVVSVVGLLGVQADAQRDAAHAVLVMRSNYEGPASILAAFAERLEARGSGALIGVSSVAGDRGRATNYVYGSAKAGLSAFLSGLRNRLAGKGVAVMTVKPGFVNTAMIAGMDTPAALTAQPDEVGEAVYRAWRKGRDVIYVRTVWWAVMAVIRAIPERIFKRLTI